MALGWLAVAGSSHPTTLNHLSQLALVLAEHNHSTTAMRTLDVVLAQLPVAPATRGKRVEALNFKMEILAQLGQFDAATVEAQHALQVLRSFLAPTDAHVVRLESTIKDLQMYAKLTGAGGSSGARVPQAEQLLSLARSVLAGAPNPAATGGAGVDRSAFTAQQVAAWLAGDFSGASTGTDVVTKTSTASAKTDKGRAISAAVDAAAGLAAALAPPPAGATGQPVGKYHIEDIDVFEVWHCR